MEKPANNTFETFYIFSFQLLSHIYKSFYLELINFKHMLLCTYNFQVTY
jgi:hypothetical protein